MEMVGIMVTGGLREQAVSYLNEAKMQADASTKTSKLKLLKEVLLHRDPSLLTEFVPHLMELQTERAAPIRNYLLQLIEDIGLKYLDYLKMMVPVLLTLMGDDMPAVARRAITVGSTLFRNTFEQVALQGIYSGKLDKIHEESWLCMVTLKDAIYSASQQHKNDGVRLHAIKFIETVILLFTPEPNGPAQPPVQQTSETHAFNFAWLLGGHPILDVASLGQEASKNLSMLLDQLRAPEAPKISGPIAAVLVNSLVSIAKQRPTLYGRVLPVLLGLVSSCEQVKGAQIVISSQTLKNAFTNLLKCSHSAAGPWRERLVSALNVIKGEDITEGATSQLEKIHPKRGERENGSLEDQPEKRLRSSPDTTNSGIDEMHSATMEESAKDFSTTSIDGELSPLQQTIARVGALASKGDEALTSIDVVITNISDETLAEVVIEYMKYLPPDPPDVSTGPALSLEVPWSTVMIIAEYFSLPGLGTIIKPSTHKRDLNRDPRRMHITADAKIEEPVLDTTSESIDNIVATVAIKTESLAAPSEEQTGFIPGISQIHVKDEPIDDLPILSGTPAIVRTQGLAISLSTITSVTTGVATVGPSVDTAIVKDIQDEKPLISATSTEDATSVSGSDIKKEARSITVIGTAFPAVWASMLSSIDAHQQQILWKMLLMRIFQSYEQVQSGGGSELRLSLLPRLIIGLDDDETWRILKEHILEDYQNHKGHELTIYTLYQLFSKKSIEKDPDLVDAVSVAYDSFLLAVAEGLRDTLPPSDKSLSKLFAEAPVLPVAALDLLGALCNPDAESKDGLELSITERITQGLSAVWSLILLRPPIRSECLDIALKCTVHHLEEVRTKAIRLVANKLYPLSYISENIERFATKMLHSVLEIRPVDGIRDMVGDGKESQVDQGTEKLISKTQFTEQNIIDEDEDAHKTSKSLVLMQEAQRCMSLFFALCTKKHSLLREVFAIYKDSPKAVKQAVHKHMPVLVRTIGCASPDVIQIISDPPPGSKNLVLLVLHVLTESTPPTADLIAAVKQLYQKKIKDAKLLTPILSSLSKEEVLPIFPHLVTLSSQDFKSALDRILQGSVHTGPALTPAEVLILIHSIDAERDHVPLSMVKDACTVCFQQRTVFTQQVLAKVLNQLVEQTPLPILFMRTVILAVGAFRSLVGFVMEILSRLVNKQIWKWPNLWIGFLKCAEQTQPQSFPILLQLPALQLEKALTRHPNLRAPLTAHAAKPSVRATLPRSTLVVLGLAQDTLPSEASSGQAENSLTSRTNTSTDPEPVVSTELSTPT